MNKASFSLHLDDATTYATVYQGEKPVASVRRRRAYGESDRKTWTVYDLEGAELFQTNLGSVTIRSRVSSILKAREAAQPVAQAPQEDRMSPQAAFAEVRRIRDELTALTGKLDHLDHDIARALNAARDDLFEGWAKLRAAQQEEA
jgi:hypothetical protein